MNVRFTFYHMIERHRLSLLPAIVFLFSASAAVAQNLDKQVVFSTVTPRLLSISITAPDLEYGRLTRYVSNYKDRIIDDARGNRWLVLNNKKIGSIVGPSRDFLYRFGQVNGEPIDGDGLTRTGEYAVSSPDDQSYSRPVTPARIGRLSRPVDSVWIEEGLAVQVEHTFYLFLDEALKADTRYFLHVPKPVSYETIEFTYSPAASISKAIHLSQLGFTPESERKIAYLSLWTGSEGSLEFRENLKFQVFNNSDGQHVLSGETFLKKPANNTDEDAYGKNYAGSDLHTADFSELKTPGTYYLLIEGIGRSEPFTISDSTWNIPLYHSLRGFYHQRNGIALAPPYTGFVRPDTSDSRKSVLKSDARLMDTGNGFVEGLDNFSALTSKATLQPIKVKQGGYFDAGDRDSRIQHLLASRNMIDLYEQFPLFFETLTLDIPESFNQVPDILDESVWALDFFCKLQDSNGLVGGGIEATGHPFFGEPSWLERHQLYTYRPGLWSTYLFAATAARASLVLEHIIPEKAANYRARAVLAMAGAEKLLAEDPNQPIEVNDARNLAAACLYRLTETAEYHDIFIHTSAFSSGTEESPVTLLYRDQHYDQAEAAWVYMNTDDSKTDAELRKSCRKALITTADYLLNSQQNTGFGWLKDPWRPPFAGAFTIPFSRDVIRAALLTGDRNYYSAVELGVQAAHGANPLNLSFTTGLGQRSPRNLHYPDARITRQSPPAGITVLGPADLKFLGKTSQSLVENYGSHCFPPLDQWPVLETFLDVFWIPIMNEFSIETMAQQVYSLGFLAAFTTRSGHINP